MNIEDLIASVDFDDATETPIQVPEEIEPSSSEDFQLWVETKRALAQFPEHFFRVRENMREEALIEENSPERIIELALVHYLNSKLPIIDPNHKYLKYRFEQRPANRFPDIIFRESGGKSLLGCEVKTWNPLTAEGDPTFRFQVSPSACSDLDLFICVPYIYPYGFPGRGSLVIFEPFIKSAKYLALLRNHYWRKAGKEVDERVTHCPNLSPHSDSDERAINDVGVNDNPGNFGRLGRLPVMKSYIDYVGKIEYGPDGHCTHPLEEWRKWVAPEKRRGK